jgi:RimJ/RimL family protein N-acetyltransferase
MAELKKYNDFSEYAKFNADFIASNPMLYYHLQNTIKRTFKGKGHDPKLYKFFNVIGDDCFVVVLLVEGECLIYADNATDEVVDKLSEGLEFHIFKRYQFFGTKQIIDALFHKHKVEYDEQKHRIIYQCKDVSSDFTYSPGQMSMADPLRITELTSFNVGFAKDYYGDTQEFSKAVQIIASGIEKDNLYQWKLGNQICAIAQAIHGDEYDFPVIGHVYTNPDHRNKGYAASIVHRLTKGLLDAGNEKCMLSTSAYTPASNKAFLRAGYTQTGEYVLRYKTR